ncbi:nitric oxide reductase activation protein NorD [Pleomorphovibrio marinus]|uniref:nitric oxide reductase activation protein NorD n=1 Tax=Pleomorphovibrio marinus TaxID=2164132 RepID=UPI000E0A96D9|nr:VWA domain-containing protein [Pleomorphovibrio marinus]
MGLDLDEWIYGKVVKYLKKKQRITEDGLSYKVDLEAIKPRLTFLARALTGKAIYLFPAEREGGYKEESFFLPAHFSLLSTWEENLSFYLFRTVFLSFQSRLGLNWQSEKEGEDLELSRQMARNTSGEVLHSISEELPSVMGIYDSIIAELSKNGEEVDYSWVYGKWMYQSSLSKKDKLQHINDRAKKQATLTPTTLLKAKAVEAIKTLQIDKKQQEDYVLLHNFEKVETAEESSGVWRDFDGKDELEDHQDALDELRMHLTVRVDDPTHSVYQAEFMENATVSESAEAPSRHHFIAYDEWDYKKTNYKREFCKVYPFEQKETDTGYYHATLQQHSTTLMNIRKMLTSLNNKWRLFRRQSSGEDFDLDALTDRYTEVMAKITPNEKVYLSKRKKEKDISILLLLDISLSTDGYAANNRVIDVEKQVSILFGEVLDEFQIDFCIDGFYSKTRNYASYLTIKDFDEKWISAKHKIGAVEPSGYTRIGAALRHAGAKLDRRSSKNKWVILLSDGKPNDYDKYEGKYGINDVKQALRELNERNTHAYALAIEASAKYYLPQMFGQNHYQILTTPIEMLKALFQIFEKIKHN